MFSKKRVAVSVDHAMMVAQKITPNMFLRSKKIAPDAKQQNGRSEYPRILMVE